MINDQNIVRYIFDFGSKKLEFEIFTAPDGPTTRVPIQVDLNYPEWTRLERNQCDCCPLKVEDNKYCPTAVRMHTVLEAFKGFSSYEELELTVETKRRTYKQHCDLQSGLNSMLGLHMATSGCPVVGKLRSMATFHVPFCTIGETLYRTVAAYLTKQYFEQKDGKVPDWEMTGLKSFYQDLEALNHAFSFRVKGIEQSNAVTDAMVMFFESSVEVATSIEEGLEEYKAYFTGLKMEPPERKKTVL